MKCVCSDTNVWIDFSIIDKVNLPFRLPYTYIMNADALDDELLFSDDLRTMLLMNGLVCTHLSYEEFVLAEMLGPRYPRLSTYDRIALAMAKIRGIYLLTGDGALRKAAKNESVQVIGTLGILDQLLLAKHISEQEYKLCLGRLQAHNGKEVRLPSNEIAVRLQRMKE
jgi:predicted nucleic acid-binding protein